MFNASVAATRYVLCAAALACRASSLYVTAAAPSATPPPRTSSLFLPIPLFLPIGRAAVYALVANVLCCWGRPRVWREERRHVRHVHGGMRPPRRRTGDRRKADITYALALHAHGTVKQKRNVYTRQAKGRVEMVMSSSLRLRHFSKVQSRYR